MTEKQLNAHNELTEQVAKIVTDLQLSTVALEDWILEGDTVGMTPQEVADEWKELLQSESII